MLDLPLQAFWGLNKQIDRLRSEEDLRRLNGALVAGIPPSPQKQEAIEQYQNTLRSQMGVVMIEEAVFDRSGLSALKEISQT